MSDAQDPKKSLIEEPPQSIGGILMRLGPGLIIAGSIVGSGELIATTLTGAKAGFWLLWLIIVGCVIKVFVQVELGRYSIVTGNTSLDGIQEVPGPRISTGRGGINWLLGYWFVMFLFTLAQLGGIVGGVGQALAISAPLTQTGKDFNHISDIQKKLLVSEKELDTLRAKNDKGERVNELTQQIASHKAELQQLTPEGENPIEYKPTPGIDDKIWAAIVTTITAVVLVIGRYGFIQTFSTLLVGSFTLITIVNLFALQFNDAGWAVTWQDLVNGMSFSLTPADEVVGDVKPLATALATFGIIGVGAAELLAYPYWCLEKGYATFTGPRDESEAWADRARGWLRVMRWDAWCSMVVYTFATIAFYLLGAAILGRLQLAPEGPEMIRTLAVMYEPVFGSWTRVLFLFGAFAVLYSTFFVANAGHARVFPDALRVMGFVSDDERTKKLLLTIFSGVFPFTCLIVYCFIPAPTVLVLASGLMQAVMLPMIAGAALYFRYMRSDNRVAPGKAWDAFLWISSGGMLLAGVVILLMKLKVL